MIPLNHMIKLARKWNFKRKWKEVKGNGGGERRERGREGRRKNEVNTVLFDFPSEMQNTEMILLPVCSTFLI